MIFKKAYTYNIGEKNKTRMFYRQFLDIVKSFVKKVESEGEDRKC